MKFVKDGVPQGSVLGPLFFLIYVNHLPQGLISDIKLFAGDASLLSIVNCAKSFASVLNNDFKKMQDWSYQWKMSFNPDRAKQTHEVVFSIKTNMIVHPPPFTLTMQLLNSLMHKRTLAFT